MKKIFKYIYSPAAHVPLNAWVLRIDHIEDGFYKGDFIWAVVDTEEKAFETLPNLPFPFSASQKEITFKKLARQNLSKYALKRVQLAIKEKQEIEAHGPPAYAEEKDGHLYVYCHDHCLPLTKYKIAVYKTGQEIDLPLEKLIYLGINRLWIIEELGLYTFLVND